MAVPSPPPEQGARTGADRPATSRRRFLQAGGVSALGLALAACASETTTGSATPSSAEAGSPTSSTGRTATTSSSATTVDDAAAGDAGDTTDAPDSAASDPSAAPPASAPLTVADFDGLATCVLLPELTAGPFPLDEQFDRRDITEGAEGQPMRLGLRVVDDACTAVPGARVEIWHCDATGDYSAFADGGGGKDEAQGSTFLRGTQTANDDGIVEFLSIVPGWYRGRAVHVHLRVHLDDSTVLTSQLFFDPDHIEQVYAAAPYADFGMPDTSNDQDAIAGDVARNGTLLVTTDAETSEGAGTLALANLGIDPTAESDGSGAGGPAGGGPGGPGGPGGGPGGRRPGRA